MQTVKWSFRPGLAASLATLFMLPVLVGLGLWQLQRADQKQAIFDAYQAKTASAELNLNSQEMATVSLDQIQWRKAVLQGRYHPGMTLLLDNQVYQGEAGYHVFNILDPGKNGRPIVVNRGWVAAGPYRNEVPATLDKAEQVDLSGRVVAFPSAPGISMGPELPPEVMAPGIYRMQTIDQLTVQNLLGKPVAEFVLRLGPESASGYTRDWPEPGSGRERHLGYAFQWFSMAVVLVILYISLNLKRRYGNES